ncbi:MAG TPA: HAD-IB family phosphatase [Gemmatimonadaceae bacterium]|nr:HAD-IB family phosphatase [Gemmatimonadaceae bacterium]
MSRFNTVIFDVDSTLSGIEGIDWLAAQRGPEIAAWSAGLTERAMQGEIPIEAVYSERMRMVKPTLPEIQRLGEVYIERIAAGAAEAIAALRGAGVESVMVSGGLRQAMLPLARELGVTEENVYAVSVFFDQDGGYAGFDDASLLTRQSGKRTLVGQMNLKGPILAVGDGMTDLEIKSVVQGFAAFTGFTRREVVIEQADYVVENFDQLRTLILE